MIIFVEKITNRLQYTFDFIFKERDLQFVLTDNKKEFLASNQPQFNYSRISFIEDIPSLIPSSMLFRKSIYNYTISKSRFHQEECLCINDKTDPFASIFYILTRYEEYHSSFIPVDTIETPGAVNSGF